MLKENFFLLSLVSRVTPWWGNHLFFLSWSPFFFLLSIYGSFWKSLIWGLFMTLGWFWGLGDALVVWLLLELRKTPSLDPKLIIFPFHKVIFWISIGKGSWPFFLFCDVLEWLLCIVLVFWCLDMWFWYCIGLIIWMNINKI